MRYQFVDCRWELGSPEKGRELYVAGHIPGASFLDVDDDLSDLSVTGQGRHPLPGAERFAAAAGRAGIGHGVFVVGYGSMGGAERLWWLLRHFGHDDCAVLAGGIDAWLGTLSTGDEEIEPAVFTPRERRGDTIEAEEIVARLGDPSLVLVDARLPARWRGEENPIDKVPGRIPGALNAPWSDAAAGAHRGRGRRVLRLGRHLVRDRPPVGARRSRGTALPRLLEPVGDARLTGRTRLGGRGRFAQVGQVLTPACGDLRRRQADVEDRLRNARLRPEHHLDLVQQAVALLQVAGRA